MTLFLVFINGKNHGVAATAAAAAAASEQPPLSTRANVIIDDAIVDPQTDLMP